VRIPLASVSQEIVADLNQIENDLRNNQKKADEFDKDFLERRNEVFDAIDDFNPGGK